MGMLLTYHEGYWPEDAPEKPKRQRKPKAEPTPEVEPAEAEAPAEDPSSE